MTNKPTSLRDLFDMPECMSDAVDEIRDLRQEISQLKAEVERIHKTAREYERQMVGLRVDRDAAHRKHDALIEYLVANEARNISPILVVDPDSPLTNLNRKDR